MDKTTGKNELSQRPEHISLSMLEQGMTDQMMEHIGKCSYCADLFAEYVEKNTMVSAPRDLKENIMAKSRNLDVRVIAASNQLSKRLQLFYYSLKVGAAVLCVLTLLTVTPGLASHLRPAALSFERLERLEQGRISWSFYENAEQLTERLNQFSIFNLEVNKNDKKEK